MTVTSPVAVRLRVTGVVQGVGFRPFTHRLATDLGLAGVVGNDDSGVWVEVEGTADAVDTFVRRLRRDAPPLAIVDGIERVDVSPTARSGFTIATSRAGTGEVTAVSPDVAVCDACLAEMRDPADRRFRHPFITCTDCGPRFTITRSLPYDRPGTTMAGFPLCATCQAEYDDPGDRRHHAQPIGCHDCGPTLRYERRPGEAASRAPTPTGAPTPTEAALAAARSDLAAGAIVAVKGIGGYHLVCDATSDAAVGELRRRKGRAEKPFAVMVADLAGAAALAHLGTDALDLLASPARPIVLAPARAGTGLSDLVAPGNPLVGLMLPSAPAHHLLLGAGPAAGAAEVGPLVATSSNASGEPICYLDADLWDRAGAIVDGVLGHDRPIHVPCDDSVVRVHAGAPMPLRRARGYAPLPVRIPATPCDVLAIGGEMKNAFCVARGDRAWMSQHVGDLANLATMEAFETSVRQFCQLYRVEPALVAIDAHPGYLGSRWARRRHPDTVVEVGHHHAHVASVMAEHGLDPDAEVIGMAFDGTGYGDDGTIWGGEVLEATALGYRRAGHLAAVPLPGGDAAIRHPWRVALAHLWAAGIPWDDDLAPVGRAEPLALGVLDHELSSGLACVPTTSMGRLFDAVSSLLGLRHDVTYEAQAAIDLEHAATGHLDEAVAVAFGRSGEGSYDAGNVLTGLIAARRAGASIGAAAAGFHLAVADLVVHAATTSRERTGTSTVVLSGGVWQNALLSALVRRRLGRADFDVRSHRVVPPNDGGLALGQLFVAAHRARSLPIPHPLQKEV